jgi:DNA-binding Lrp family transcriptional regulator
VLQHDVNELAIEIARWKEGCQEALRRLHKASILQGYQVNMTRLLEMFGIPPEVVGFNADTDDFD